MELTKIEKHELYKQCLIDVEKCSWACCCISFQNTLMPKLQNTSVHDFLSNSKYTFPELYELKTKSNTSSMGYWFSTQQERIEALKKCIEQTKS